ncbi:MAG TPA: selenide, water dikinase SelD [Candidatus Acidoferrum sp.]|nr:selenide, water dikinase SelD [Candidatus Acidoferrum sp.]
MKIDFAKRRRVMERSQRLGHCICDVRRPCPCDLLREQNLCPCAGERPEPAAIAQVKLMDFVRNAGCASKIAPADLDAVLGRLPAVEDPAVISGLAAADDAAIYRLADDLCLVQTVDVFTPCVDDPRLFGRICAANCLSDIYAMGGVPRTALSVLAFPSEKLPGEIIYQMLAGAMEVFKQAGVALIGGHSVKDDEIKLGFAITGLINPAVAAALDKPKAGDALVLTKPLGTGVLVFCRQIGRDNPAGMAAAELSMAALNRAAAEAMKEAGASACTDVTGFGLFAHLGRMLRAAGLGAEIFADALPAFDGALEALRQGVIPGAIERNREYVGDALRPAPGVDEAAVNLGFDAQTSGGLLIAVPQERLENLRQSLARRGAGHFVIGKLMDGAAGHILLSPATAKAGESAKSNSANASPEIVSMNTPATNSPAQHEACCAEAFQNQAAAGTAAESQKAFGALIRSVQAAGTLDEKTKELILFSLVVASRCHPCFEAHERKARDLGIPQAQLDEAAWCAIALGGAPVKMFYQQCLARLQADKERQAHS